MEFDQLVKHMSPECRDIFEQSVAIASSRSHFSIDLEHWVAEVFNQPVSDIEQLLKHFDLKIENLISDITDSMESLKTGNDGFPKISPDLIRVVFDGWMIASTEYESLRITPVHIVLALLDNANTRLRLLQISPEFEKITASDMREQCNGLLLGQFKEEPSSKGKSLTSTPALDQFTINLTDQARQGKIDKIIGRDEEVRQMIDVLCRRKQNNPILTGEAGVGKTAVVEGLAERIASNNVPHSLQGVELHTLDLGLLQAGAGVKGEFENRLKNVIKEVQQSPVPIILFIDEAHTLIGAGNQAGAGDAANLLKPALARGELRTIAATTWAEYKKYFESDAALTRRFQVVKIEEPSEEKATVMLRSVSPGLEHHHGVTILDEAVRQAVILSHRYIAGRQLPDKCVSLLDTACARVNLSLTTPPASLEFYQKQMENLSFECDRLTQEQANGFYHGQQITELQLKRAAAKTACDEVEERWESAKSIIETIAVLRHKIERLQTQLTDNNDDANQAVPHENEMQGLIDELKAAREQLNICQGDTPLLYECVDSQVIAEVVADWTGIPVGRMQNDEIEKVIGLQGYMKERVIGQDHGLTAIAKAIKTARTNLADPNRPRGVFMLVGPSGVGKTETALALAEQLYGSEKSMTVINMSEFKEEHKVSLLMGSPPGYVGYGEGGVLTEAVRRKPYSVVLLDEMEKAHPGVQDIFYQVFDKGMLRDGEGRDIDFKNTVIIMTSNAASEQISNLCEDPDTRPAERELLEAINPTLRETYKPAFLGRVNVVPYFPLDDNCLADIARIQLNLICQRVRKHYKAELVITENFVNSITQQCRTSDTGARQISALLNHGLLPQMAEVLLMAMSKEMIFDRIIVDINEDFSFDILLEEKKENIQIENEVNV